MKRPTMKDVAEKAGVGVATVDRVINQRAPVRQETAEVVLAAAEAVGFRAANLIRLYVEKPGKEYKLGFILQKHSTPFYRDLSKAIHEACRQVAAATIKPEIMFLDELTPSAVVAALHKMSQTQDAVSLVAADHPTVNEAIDQLRAKGVPVVSLLSDLSAASRAGHIGLDNRMAGRTAAWTITRLCKRPGKIGIVMGSHRYICQELAEVSFRSYCRENAPEFTIVEATVSLEDSALAQAATLELLHQNPDLVGIYCAGGGVAGVIEALREELTTDHLITVCNEITEETRSALIDGIVDLVISHPRKSLSENLIAMMQQAIEQKKAANINTVLLPFDLYLSENV